MEKIPFTIDLVVSFAVQFIIFYFIMTRLTYALGLGRLNGALLLSLIFTGFHAAYVYLTGKSPLHQFG